MQPTPVIASGTCRTNTELLQRLESLRDDVAKDDFCPVRRSRCRRSQDSSAAKLGGASGAAGEAKERTLGIESRACGNTAARGGARHWYDELLDEQSDSDPEDDDSKPEKPAQTNT